MMVGPFQVLDLEFGDEFGQIKKLLKLMSK